VLNNSWNFDDCLHCLSSIAGAAQNSNQMTTSTSGCRKTHQPAQANNKTAEGGRRGGCKSHGRRSRSSVVRITR
jgi:hypothetical protein